MLREDLVDAVSKEVIEESEESPLLEAVTRELPVNTEQTEKT
jgi:hypothetical protein